MNHSLLVIGAGDLGLRVARAWRERFPTARIVAETLSPSRHSLLREAGAEPRLRSDAPPGHFDRVAFCVPPSDDYAAEAERAASLGLAVHVSSTAVYREKDGGWIEEDSPLAESPRARRLLAAEAAITARGGRVVRLTGLYDRERGPHVVYRREKTSPARPDAWVNLIHLDDAASLVVEILLAQTGGIFLGTDGVPLRRAMLAPGARFEGQEGDLGKRCTNFRTREHLGWEPRHPSLMAFESGAAESRLRKRASSIVVHEGRLLLTRQRDPVTEYDYLFLPGGAIENGESPREAAARETHEETGYDVRLDATGSRLEYDFTWGGIRFACDTEFFTGGVASFVGKGEFTVEWLPLAAVGRMLRYHAPLRDHVLRAVARHPQLA